MPRNTASATTNPLPSLIRASAWDEGNRSMQRAGRKVWSRADYNVAARKQNELVIATHGRWFDREGSKLPFIRFQIAEQMERSGHFTVTSKYADICEDIDASLVASIGIPLTH